MKPHAIINHIASYVPEQVLTNFDLEKIVDTSDEWIISRTGIRQRRIAQADEFTSDMGIHAALSVCQKASLDPMAIDVIITTTMTPDYLCPSTAALIQHGIGAHRAAAFDIQAACSGFIYGLSIAKAYIESGLYSTVLLVSSEKNSAFIDYTDRNTCILFGDGASAALITNKNSGLSIGSIHLGADGSLSDLIMIPAGGSRLPASDNSFQTKQHTLKMNGKETFKHAVRRMEEAIHACLIAENISPSDIQWLVPHQANIRIIEAVAKRFSIPQEHIMITIDTLANTSSSTIPIALDRLLQKDVFNNNDYLVLTAFGGGLTWGSALLQYQKD